MLRITFPLFITLALVAAEYTPAEKSAICWALCRNDGYNSGHYEEKKKVCSCVREINYREFTDVRIKVPIRARVKEREEDESD